MQRRNPQTTWSLSYQPLNPGSHEFRILTLHGGTFSDAIRCSMQIVSFEAAKSRYHALSYRWGDENDRKQILVDETPLSVTANLHTALKHLRFIGADRDLWIDQICINQSDKKEKMHQISLMKPIYAESIQVIVWLGESDRHLEKLANILSDTDLSSSLTRASEPDGEDGFSRRIRTIYHLILHMCHREWWTRVWVVQECVTSVNSPIFQCGDCSFTFTQLEAAFEALMDEPHYLTYSGGDDAELQQALEHSQTASTDLLRPIQNMLELRQMLSSAPQRTISLIDCLQLTVCRSASDPLDYVYGFFGLMPPDESQELIQDTVIPARELFHKFMVLALRSGVENDTLGCYQALQVISFDKKESAGPSWVPDFTEQSFSNRNNSVYLTPIVPAKTRFTPQIWFEKSDTVMNMAGYYLDTVTDTQLLTSGWNGLSEAIARCQDQAIKPRTSSSKGTFNASEESVRARSRLLFTCNFKLHCLPNQSELLNELWGLWIHSEIGHTESSQHDLDGKVQRLGTATVQSVFDEFRLRSGAACEGRSWFQTTNNYLGIAVPGVRSGDVVVLPRGFVMPLILRPGEGCFKLIGGAYVDGLVEDGAVDVLVDKGEITERCWSIE